MQPDARARWPLSWAALAVVLVAGAAGCSGGTGAKTSVGEISSVTYSQDEAVPDFDSSPHTVTDPGRLAALRQTLQDDGWKQRPATEDSGPSGCSGGTSTTLQISFASGAKSTISVYRCGSSNDRLTTDLTSLVDSWR